MLGGFLLTIAALLGMGAAAYLEVPYLPGILKAAASIGFLWVAAAAGAFQSAVGVAILVGLFFSFWGDIFLIGSSEAIFLAGLISFFIAHVCYALAFGMYRLNMWRSLACLMAVLLAAFIIYPWLMPNVEGGMRIPVMAYMVIISLMVLLAAGTTAAPGGWILLAGAVLFYISDIFVARDRFVNPGVDNRLIGLPLYYAGQLVLAYGISRLKG